MSERIKDDRDLEQPNSTTGATGDDLSLYDWTSYIGRACIVRPSKSIYSCVNDVLEVKVLQVSPRGLVKLRFTDGVIDETDAILTESWFWPYEYCLVDVLPSPPPSD